MIPVRDSQKTENRPVVTQVLIIFNILVFLLELSYGSEGQAFLDKWGMVYARYTTDMPVTLFQLFVTPVTSMFLHAGWLHILCNMWILWIFGDKIEEALGQKRFILFYFICGLSANFTQFLFSPFSQIPVLGANGAIAGVLGAYLFLYPAALITLFFPPAYKFEVPACFFPLFWLALVGLFGLSGHFNDIAWWGHIGSCAMGFFLIWRWAPLPKGNLGEKIKEAWKEFSEDTTTLVYGDIQAVYPRSRDDSANLYAMIYLEAEEALAGCVKEIDLPKKFRVRLCKIDIPPNTVGGQKLHIPGLGKENGDGSTGDLILTAWVGPFEERTPEIYGDIQVVRPRSIDDSPDLYANIFLETEEALTGGVKEVDIPQQHRVRLCKIDIPPNTMEGQQLRIPGLGKKNGDGSTGDLILIARVGSFKTRSPFSVKNHRPF